MQASDGLNKKCSKQKKKKRKNLRLFKGQAGFFDLAHAYKRFFAMLTNQIPRTRLITSKHLFLASYCKFPNAAFYHLGLEF